MIAHFFMAVYRRKKKPQLLYPIHCAPIAIQETPLIINTDRFYLDFRPRLYGKSLFFCFVWEVSKSFSVSRLSNFQYCKNRYACAHVYSNNATNTERLTRFFAPRVRAAVLRREVGEIKKKKKTIANENDSELGSVVRVLKSIKKKKTTSK